MGDGDGLGIHFGPQIEKSSKACMCGQEPEIFGANVLEAQYEMHNI